MTLEELKRRVVEALKEQEQRIAQARKRIPPEYHDFIVLLEQSKVVANEEVKLDDELRKLGVFTFKGRTFVRVTVPYVSVDGRLAMFADAHKEAGKTYKITSNLPAIAEHMLNTGMRPSPDVPVIVWIESELYGLLEGESRIFWDQTAGAHATNPLEVAKTSALGRAIAQAGIGLIGTGIASAEEVQSAVQSAEEAADPDRFRRAVFAHLQQWAKDEGLDWKAVDAATKAVLCSRYGVPSRSNLTPEQWSEILGSVDGLVAEVRRTVSADFAGEVVVAKVGGLVKKNGGPERQVLVLEDGAYVLADPALEVEPGDCLFVRGVKSYSGQRKAWVVVAEEAKKTEGVA